VSVGKAVVVVEEKVGSPGGLERKPDLLDKQPTLLFATVELANDRGAGSRANKAAAAALAKGVVP
jgi:hypothetical protein